MPTENMIALFHRSHAIPLIAVLFRRRGAKFVTLASEVRASRDSISATLSHLTDLGVVERNKGYGHPLRPEYVLTERGLALAPYALELMAAIQSNSVTAEKVAVVCKRKWSMPALLAVSRGSHRFSELERALPGITPRALTTSLKDLGGASLVDRVITETWPPHTLYRETPLATPFLAPLAGLFLPG